MIPAAIPENEEQRLQRLNELGILDTLEEQAYDDLTYLASQICNTPIALVSLVDKERQWFKSHHGLDAHETPRDVAFCAHAILDDKTFVVEDSSKDERFNDNPLATDAPFVKFYAGAPLIMGNNLRLGTLCVIANEPRVITEEQIKALESLARQVVSQLELRMKVNELECLDNAKDEFISMVSHELRTPLTSISGSLALLVNNKVGQLDDAQFKMVDIASRNTDRLLCTVNDILDLAKIEAGKLEIEQKPVNVAALLKKAVELNRPFCSECICDITLNLEPGDSDKSISADENRLLQVLTNLISNAAKFSHDDGIIELSLEVKNNIVRIEVTDHGPGIIKDQHEAVFQKFKQIGGSVNNKKPGTGLGLNICKQIVELHGGNIGFNSIPDEMTTFYFTLPILE